MSYAHPWPYPRLIAHRGAGRHAPENTLAALRLGARHGFRMAEADVRLSQDGVPFLLHDHTLERTTNGHGAALDHRYGELALLDAGSWHGSAYAGEPLATLHAWAAASQALGVSCNLELKPHPGDESRTGAVVASVAMRLWSGALTRPLLSSFSDVALAAARVAAPTLPRALLLDEPLTDDGLRRAARLGCVAIHLSQAHLTDIALIAIREAGFAAVAWTVNDPARLHALLASGCHAVVTDETERFGLQASLPA